MEQQKQTSRRAIAHVPELDGLRGVAILLVLLFHYQRFPAHSEVVHDVLNLGWSGVDLFFVLSGFLITSILLKTKGTSRYFSTFYARRVLRIFPLYFAVLFIYFHVILPFVYERSVMPGVATVSEKWYWFYLSNWPESLGTLWPEHLANFWSLAVEEQFYFIWPALIFLVDIRRLRIVCYTLIVCCPLASILLAMNAAHVELLQRATFLRISTLAFGAWVAIVVTENRTAEMARQGRWVPLFALGGIAAMTILSGSSVSTTMFSVGTLLFAILYSALLLRCIAHAGSDSLTNRTLRSNVLRSFGRYSYGIYVLHVVVYKAELFFGTWLLSHNFARPFVVVVVPLCCVGLSWSVGLASWHLLEKHFLRLKDVFTYSTQRNPNGKATLNAHAHATNG